MKGVAARSGPHLFGQAVVLAAASFMLLAPACGQVLTVQSTESVVTVTIGGPTFSYTKMKGKGILVKRGNGYLDLTGVTVGNFRGSIRLEAGAVLIRQDRNLGQNENSKKQAGLIFSGGTLSFAAASITLGDARLITVATEGTFNTGYSAKVNSTLVGSGRLRKTGYGYLDFSNVKAEGFMGTLRIEEGDLIIVDDKNLGHKDSVLELAGGELDLTNLTTALSAKRQIVIYEGISLGESSGAVTINSRISVKANQGIVLTLSRIDFGVDKEKSNYIENMRLSAADITGDAASLGGDVAKTVFFTTFRTIGSHLTLNQKRAGQINGWQFEETYEPEKISFTKIGAGRLTIVNSDFGNIDFRVKEGTIVDKGLEWESDYRGYGRDNVPALFMEASATLEINVDARVKQTISYNIRGDGKMVKKGEGLLDMSGEYFFSADFSDFFGYLGHSNEFSRLEIQEGTVSIDEDKNLGNANATLSFKGGTLSFAAASITLGDARLITVATEGTFDTGYNAKVNSTLVGAGRLTKTGSGDLDFREIAEASGFTGGIRMKEGSLLIDEDRDLGGTKSLIFSGGTLSFLAPYGRGITMGADRLITVATEGTFDTGDEYINVHVESTLVGSGLLRKTDYSVLDFSNIKADKFTGTLRIELGYLVIVNDNNLGDQDSVLELASGILHLADMTTALSSARKINIDENDSAINGPESYNYLEPVSTVTINSRISMNARKDIILSLRGNIYLRRKNQDGEKNYIEDIYTNGNIIGDTNSLRGDIAKTVFLGAGQGSSFTLDQEQAGHIKGWDFTSGYYYEEVPNEYDIVHVMKAGMGRLTIVASTFEYNDLHVKEGTVVDKGIDHKKNNPYNRFGFSVSVYTSATLEIDVGAGDKQTVFYSIDGDGKMIKKGKGLLDMSGTYHNYHGDVFTYSNSIGYFEIQEGTVSIDEDKDLGSGDSSLIFSGGAVRFGGASITLGAGRLITVAAGDGGAFDTMGNTVYVHSMLDGAGELRKTGSGVLDFKNVQASLFKGSMRIEEGTLLIEKDDDLGRSGLVFSGGTLHLDASSAPITLSRGRTVSAATGNNAFFALNNTIEIKEGFINGIDAATTVQMNLQKDTKLRIDFDASKRATINNWVFQSGGNNIIDIMNGMGQMTSTLQQMTTNPLVVNNAVFKSIPSSSTVTIKGSININRRVEFHNWTEFLDLRDWAVSITGRRMDVSLAHITPTSSTTTITSHLGPRLLSGNGFLRKEGAGYFDMSETDSSGFSGTLRISGGTVKVGSFNADNEIEVLSGTMQGAGTVGPIEVSDGATLYHPSGATLHIAGDYTQIGGVYRVRLGKQFEPVVVSGTASIAGTLDVALSGDDSRLFAIYPVLRAATITGTFEREIDANIFSNILLQTVATTISSDLEVLYVRNNAGYRDYVQGRNGEAVAWALTQIEGSHGNPANYALLHITSADQARRALSSLSGEMHVSAGSALMSSGLMLENAAVGQMRMAFGKQANASQRSLRATAPIASFGLANKANAGGGLGIWAKSLEIEKRYGGSGDIRSLSYSSSGSLLGFDLPVGDWRAGLFSGTSQVQFAHDAGQSTGTDDSHHAGMYATRMWGQTALRAGISYSNHEIKISRKLHLPGADNKLNSNYKAHTYAFFGQLDRRFGLGGVLLEPFVGLSHVRHTTGKFVETGAFGLAIRSDGQQDSASVASAGLGVSGGFQLGFARVQARGMLAWKHEVESDDAVARQSLGASGSFDVYGAEREANSLELDAGMNVFLDRDARVSITYSELDLLDADGRDGYFRAVLELSM